MLVGQAVHEIDFYELWLFSFPGREKQRLLGLTLPGGGAVSGGVWAGDTPQQQTVHPEFHPLSSPNLPEYKDRKGRRVTGAGTRPEAEGSSVLLRNIRS